jgi:hypothetical protein
MATPKLPQPVGTQTSPAPAVAAREQPAPNLVDDTALLMPMRSQLETLQSRLAALETKMAGTSAEAAGNDQILHAIADSQAALAQSINTLAQRLDRQQDEIHNIAASDATARALVLAAGQLRTDLAGSSPYDAPLEVLKSLAANDPQLRAPLATLGPWAKAGLPGREILAARLAELGPKLTLPASAAANAPWWRRLLDRILSLVVVSRVAENGDAATLPPGPQRRFAEAQAALAKGDLAGAVAAMQQIPPPQDAVVFPWLTDAAARAAAEAACGRIDAIVTQRLAGSIAAGGDAPAGQHP